jgi:hypothetical protein
LSADPADGQVGRLDLAMVQLVAVGPVLAGAAVAWLVVARREEPLERLCWWTSFPVLAAGLGLAEPALAAAGWMPALLALADQAGRLARAAWVGLGVAAALTVGIAAHTISPLVRLPRDPTEAFTGGRVLAEAVTAWGEPAVYAENASDAAWIRFYGGVPAATPPASGPPAEVRRLLYVRPLAGQGPPGLLAQGWDSPGPARVVAWREGRRPGLGAPVAAWEVWALERSGLAGGASGGGAVE